MPKTHLFNNAPQSVAWGRRPIPGRRLKRSDEREYVCVRRPSRVEIFENVGLNLCRPLVSEPGRKRRLWNTVEPPCATTSHKRPPIQNTKVFPVKALQLEPLVNAPPVSDLACVARVSVWFRSKEIPRKGTSGIPRSFRLHRTETRATHAISDRDHFMGLTINDFPLFLTSCKRPLDSVFDLCFRCLHYVT